MKYSCIIVLVSTLVHSGACAKILGFFIVPSFSHQIIFQAICRELALNGHNVTIVSPNTFDDSNVENLKEIYVPQVYKVYETWNPSQILSPKAMTLQRYWRLSECIRMSTEIVLEDVNVQELLTSEEEFDIVIVQAMNPLAVAIAARFKTKLIGESVCA